MVKKILLIIFLIFIASVLVMPFALPNCGTNGFFVGFPTKANSCHDQKGLAHFAYMADLLLGGNVTSIVILMTIIFGVVVYNYYNRIRTLRLPILKNVFSRTVIGKLKPFDELLLALKKGIIHPKTF